MGISPRITHVEIYNYLVSDLLPRAQCPEYVSTFHGFLLIDLLNSNINSLILDYLTTEGYPSAAEKFSSEANLQPLQDQESMKARRQIQHHIHSGNIQEAIEGINDLESSVSTPLPYPFSCDD